MDKKTFVEIRKGKGWGQKKLASKLGKNVRTIKRYESGATMVPTAVARLMEFFNLA